MDSAPVSRILAEFCANTRFETLPPTVVEDTQRAVLDWIGSALAGALEPPAVMARDVVRTMGTASDATVVGGGRSSAVGAALANGVASHVLELDDVHKGSTLHAAAPIIPAALAIAEREHASGRDFLLAVALGYETAFRIGEAVNPSHYRFWHPTGTVATFGAAVAAGSLLHLDPDTMLDALGSAGTQASGLWEFNTDGAMSKALHPGKAAMNGILSADLAKAGFTGATRILEGERGFFRATATRFEPTRVTIALGNHWKISENCYKLHACCGHTHTAIDVAVAHRASAGWTAREALDVIDSVEVDTYAQGYEIVKQQHPVTPYQAKFSLVYCVAVALLEGQVGLEQFAAERFNSAGVVDRAVASLMTRIDVRAVAEMTERYPSEWGTRVTFRHRDGTQAQAEAAFPRGNPERPLSTLQLEAKLRALVIPRYNSATATAAIQFVDDLDSTVDMHAALTGVTSAASHAQGA